MPAFVLAAEPEAQRLPTEDFHEGLIQLRLFDLLDYHLRIHPPDDELVLLLLQRRVKLATSADELADASDRQAALAKANAILADVIREHGTDKRIIQWQLTLAKSLIYQQAEPYYSSILYRGGTPADRERLLASMGNAIGTLSRLLAFLESEYARIDELSLGQYQLLDDSGYVTEIETAMPRAEYMLRWAKFYHALAMEASSSRRRELLENILDELTQQSSLLTMEHTVTHVQAQSLLLAGMTCRRLADYESANRYLRDAIKVTKGIPNPRERGDLQWLVALASVEQIRVLRDTDRLDAAVKALGALRQQVRRTHAGDFGYELILALLESSIEQARVGRVRSQSDAPLAEPLTDRAVQPLMALARQQPAYRDEIYATLYAQIRNVSHPARLHPFQQCALIAGHLAEATRLRHGNGKRGDALGTGHRQQAEAKAMTLLDQTIALARGLAENRNRIDGRLYCEAIYNLGVAQHQRGRRMEAATRLSAVAEQCPRFPRALSAATYAVEIVAQLAEDPTLRSRREISDLFIHTLRVLVGGFEDSEAAEYWRFFLAQALEDTGHPNEAAKEYAHIGKNHPHFLTAGFRAIRCQVLSLNAYAATHPDKQTEIIRLASNARRSAERFKTTVSRGDHSSDRTNVKGLLAETDVLLAEMDVLVGVDRPGDALALLQDFERRHPERRDLIGRVLRVRIIAFEATGRLKEAKQAVPQYIASAPKEAGTTLQSLFDATQAEIEHYRDLQRDDLANQKAQAALLFAEQLYEWAKSPSGTVAGTGLYVLRLQLAEANLEAGQYDEALKLFRQTVEEDATQYGDGIAHSPRVVMGLAKTLLGQGQYADALLLFNRVYGELSQGSTERFAALLGDLRCRTELDEDPTGIVNVIRQHRYLNPDMGGPHLKERFEKLQRRNEKRIR